MNQPGATATSNYAWDSFTVQSLRTEQEATKMTTRIRKALLPAIIIAVAALGGTSSVGQATAPDDDGPGLKCQGCVSLRCPDVGALVCFRGEITISAGPFGSVTGEVFCYQSEEGSEGLGCDDDAPS